MTELEEARRMLEAAGIIWRRDYDAVLIGFLLGVLTTLACQRVWG